MARIKTLDEHLAKLREAEPAPGVIEAPATEEASVPDDPAAVSSPAGIEVLTNARIPAIQTNARVFQYKAGSDLDGVSERLRDVTQWDSNRTGIALVYEYADGRREIVDGHQRLGLAKRMVAAGQQVDLPVRVLREVDGVTPAMARQAGAEKNIAEGTGSSIDAAKIFRETRQTASQLNLPRNSQLVRDGDSLSRLSEQAFGMVINEVASQKNGAIVGNLVSDQSRHADILSLLGRIDPANATQAEAIVRQAMDSEVTETQTDMFGTIEVASNLYVERAKVMDQALKDLGAEITTFKTLGTRGAMITDAGNILQADANAARQDAATAARASLMKQANTKGAISDALTQAARAVKNGGTVAAAAKQFVAAIQTADAGSQKTGAGTGSTGGSDGRPEKVGTQGDVKPTYIQRSVLNGDEIRQWAISQGFTSTLPADDMHVTLVYSKTPVDRSADAFQPVTKGIAVRGGARSVAQFGDAAVALTVESDALAERNAALLAAGASSDFPDYRPHITISYSAESVDLAKVVPFKGAIRLGPETVADIKEDAAADAVKVEVPAPVNAAPVTPKPAPARPAKVDYPTTLDAIAPKGRLSHVYGEYRGQRFYVESMSGSPKAAMTEFSAEMPDVAFYATDRADGTSINGDLDGLRKAVEARKSIVTPKPTPSRPAKDLFDQPGAKGGVGERQTDIEDLIDEAEPNGTKESRMPDDEVDTFVATMMTDLAQVDDLFGNPRSESRSIRKVFGDIDPTVKYIHDGTTEPAETSVRDRADELGVDHMYVFTTANNQKFRVYEKDDSVWLDVSFLTEGSGGSTIYAAVFDYAHNNDKVFIGDPEGLSTTALRRRTDNMLSSALKWGTTAHMAPHKAQLDGDISLGVAPLRWKTGDDLGNLTSLIEVSVSNLIHDIPEVANARYDFASRTFRDGSDRRILLDGDGTSGQPGIQRSPYASSDRNAVRTGEGKSAPDGVSDAWNGRTRDRAASAGRRTLKRGILLNTLAHAESGQRPGLLARALHEPGQLVRDGLQGTFYSRLPSSAKVSDLSDKSLAPADFRPIAEAVQAEIGKSIPGGKITGRLVRGLADAAGIPIQGRQRGASIEVNPAAPDGVVGVVRHEIVHVLRDEGLWGKPYGMFIQNEWQGLVRAARADKALMADIATRYAGKGLTPAKLVEEGVGEQYRLWAKGNDGAGPLSKTFGKIKAFLTAVANALRGRGFQSAARTFQMIADGDVGGRGPDGPKGKGGEAEMVAYHGTRATFDKFNTEFMGSGEGAQAFGWGHYFAGRRALAEHYRDKLSTTTPDHFTLNSKRITKKDAEAFVGRSSDQPAGVTMFLARPENLTALVGNARKFRNALQVRVNEYDKEAEMFSVRADDLEANLVAGQKIISTYSVQDYRDRAKGINARRTELQSFMDGLEFVSEKLNGRLYTVDIPEDSELLDWDAPLPEQPKSVNSVLTQAFPGIMVSSLGDSKWKELPAGPNLRRSFTDQFGWEIVDHDYFFAVLDRNGNSVSDQKDLRAAKASASYMRNQRGELAANMTGREAYNMLANMLGGPRAASEALRAAGIPGHRFLDGQSRADGDGSRNYVIYDESRISIEGRELRMPDNLPPRDEGGRFRDATNWLRDIPTNSKSWAKDNKSFFANLLTDSMGGGRAANLLALVPGRSLFAELAKNLNAAKAYLRIKEEMDALRNEWHSKTDVVAQDWRKLLRSGKAINANLMELMHASTLAGIDPSKPYDGDKRDQVRRESYAKLRADFMALPESHRKMFSTVANAYDEMGDAFEAAVLENIRKAAEIGLKRAERAHRAEMRRIKDEGLQGKVKDDAVAEADSRLSMAKGRSGWALRSRINGLRKQFESNRLKGPYFPLARFGNYFVTLRNEEGKVVSFSRYENVREQTKFADQKRTEGIDVQIGVMDQSGGLKDQVDPSFVADVQGLLADFGADTKLMDAVWQRWLETLPDQSIRTSRIHRKGREGYDKDALRAFTNHLFHGSHQLARLKYGLDLEEALADADLEARNSADPNRAQLVVNEMRKRLEFTMNPTGGPVAARLSSLAYIWYLGMSPAAALVNLSQTTVLGPPILGAKFPKVGITGAMKALALAAKDYGMAKGDITATKRVNNAEKAALTEAFRRGTIDKTQAHDLASVAETGVEYNGKAEAVMKVVSWAFHRAEVANRSVTFLAGYRMARADGMNHEDAIEVGADLTWKTHFDYQGCVDDQTQILTMSGWKQWDQLSEGEIVLSTDDQGRAVETTINAVNIYHGRQTIMTFDGKGARKFSMALTGGHKAVAIKGLKSGKLRGWSAPHFVEAKDLDQRHHIQRTPLVPISRPESVGVDMAALLGWFAAEGWYAKNRGAREKNNVRMEQSLTHNQAYVAEIDELLGRLGGQHSRHLVKGGKHVLWSLNGELAKAVKAALPEKLLTWNMVAHMSAHEMGALVDAFVKGDGSKRGKNGITTISQKASSNIQNLDVLQAMATAIGKTASLSFGKTRDFAWLSMPGTGRVQTAKTAIAHLERGEMQVNLVWCPTTETGRWIARRNGCVFVTGNSSRPRVMQNDAMKIVTTFRQFTVNMLFRLFRDVHQVIHGETVAVRKEARTQLVGISLSMFAHAGIRGVWGYGIITTLLGMFFEGGDDDVERYLQDALLIEGDGAGPAAWNYIMGAALNGIPGQVTGVDLTNRMGMPNLWFRDGESGLDGEETVQQFMVDLLGPVAGIGLGFGRGAQYIADGDVFRGVEAAVPKVIRDVMKAGRYGYEGVLTRRGDPIVEDVGVSHVIKTALGFTPADVAERYDFNSRMMNRNELISGDRIDIQRAVGDYIIDGATVPDSVWDQVRAFNREYPTDPITSDTIRQSVQGRQRASARNEFGIQMNPKLNDRIRGDEAEMIYPRAGPA